MPVMTTRRSFIVSERSLETPWGPRKHHHGMFPAVVSALPEAAAATLFVSSMTLGAMHDFSLVGIFKRVQAESADHAVGQRFAFRVGMQCPRDDCAKKHQRAGAAENKHHEFSDREFHRRE